MIFPMTLVILIVALIAKDTSYLGDPYFMRGLAQGLCLLVGGMWVMTRLNAGLLARYWPILLYLAALMISVGAAAQPIYVMLQVVSLTAVVLFFIAYFEVQRTKGYRSELFMRSTVVAYGVVMIVSLLVAWLLPQIAYETLYAGEIRFRGLFAKAGMMGSAAGLVIGIAWFGLKRWWARLPLIVPAAICLGLTLSRTFWVALVVAWAVTAWITKPQSRKWVMGMAFIGGLAAAALLTFHVQLDTETANRIFRTSSITNLTGRVSLWEEGLDAFKRSPLVGYGFTVGSDGLDGQDQHGFGRDALSFKEARQQGRRTLHSGYLQSMLDAGIIGTFFYALTMMMALRRVWKLGREPRFAPYFFALLYLMVANLSQNVVYSASVYDSIFFWGVAVFALSLPNPKARARFAGVPSHA
jgi:O-antigen ligase